jgi:hypothetical protein
MSAVVELRIQSFTNNAELSKLNAPEKYSWTLGFGQLVFGGVSFREFAEPDLMWYHQLLHIASTYPELNAEVLDCLRRHLSFGHFFDLDFALLPRVDKKMGPVSSQIIINEIKRPFGGIVRRGQTNHYEWRPVNSLLFEMEHFERVDSKVFGAMRADFAKLGDETRNTQSVRSLSSFLLARALIVSLPKTDKDDKGLRSKLASIQYRGDERITFYEVAEAVVNRAMGHNADAIEGLLKKWGDSEPRRTGTEYCWVAELLDAAGFWDKALIDSVLSGLLQRKSKINFSPSHPIHEWIRYLTFLQSCHSDHPSVSISDIRQVWFRRQLTPHAAAQVKSTFDLLSFGEKTRFLANLAPGVPKLEVKYVYYGYGDIFLEFDLDHDYILDGEYAGEVFDQWKSIGRKNEWLDAFEGAQNAVLKRIGERKTDSSTIELLEAAIVGSRTEKTDDAVVTAIKDLVAMENKDMVRAAIAVAAHFNVPLESGVLSKAALSSDPLTRLSVLNYLAINKANRIFVGFLRDADRPNHELRPLEDLYLRCNETSFFPVLFVTRK